MYIGPYVKYRLFLLDFIKCWLYSPYLGKILKQISWNLVQWQKSCLMWTDRQNNAKCPFLHFYGSAQKYLINLIEKAQRNFKNLPLHKISSLTAYAFGKYDVKFVCSGYIKSSHFQKPMFFCVSTKRKSTNDIIVSHVLTFVMLDTSHIVTPYNALWSHNVTKTVIMLPAL